MGCSSSKVQGRIALDDGLYTSDRRERAQEKLQQDRLAGTDTSDVVLLGTRSQAVVDRIDELRDETFQVMPHADLRVVRRTPTPEGVIATVFTTGALTATLLDVSLVPGELEQYSGCLMHALAFVFSVDLARYDEPESSPTSVKAALKQFKKLCDTTWCIHGTPIVLLFDNEDAFARKLANEPLWKSFPSYEGPRDYSEDWVATARNWIAARFYELNMDASRNMYGHFTHMDDPALARVVSAFVQDILIQHALMPHHDHDHDHSHGHGRRFSLGFGNRRKT
ncbi:unnamed protein product [Peniophora sp. CBMAI 1063]|nr:unnamed protein product [Peniophora sp. CBMAI 1063]